MRRLLPLAAALVLTGCEFSVATPPPLPVSSASPSAASSGPSITMSRQWQIVDGTWTFTGYVNPLGSPTRVVLDVGYDIAQSNTFETAVPVVDEVTEAQTIKVDLPTPEGEKFLCVRFRAENADGDGVTRPECYSTDLADPSAGVIVVTASPSAEPSPS